MSDRLPYEEQLSQQWNDLPLPDENMAWEDMKRRLDEDDDKPFPPFWLRGCAGWGLLGILLLGLGWWLMRPEKWGRKKQGDQKIKIVDEKKISKENDTTFKLGDTGTTMAYKDYDLTNDDTKTDSARKTSGNSPGKKPVTANKGETDHNTRIIKPGLITGKKRKEIKVHTGKTAKSKKIKNNGPGLVFKKEGDDKNKQQKDSSIITKYPKVTAIDSSISIIRTTGKIDSVQKLKPDSSEQKPKQEEATVKKSKTDSTKKKPLSFSAGIGLQQQLPVAGQKMVPYNSLGRKGTLADYIPSVYIRMTKPGKWFLQSEFRYGAPQYTKEFLFRQQSVNDTGSSPRFKITTSYKLKKTYYHQLPFTFNYFIRPNWSVGIGIQWNKFGNAIAEKETIYRNNILQQDSLLSKFIQKEKRDTASEFKKSYFQAVIETQYKRKRFSFGARYSFGLEPYIKFTLPGAVQQEERNNSLQLFIRYELWKTKR